METSIEHGAQGESGEDESPPTEGAEGRADVPPSSELSDGEGAAARREGDIPADCLLYTSPSPRDQRGSRMPSSA